MTDSSFGLYSSKRKFYRLLDNLSTSKVQLSSDKSAYATTVEPPTKRFRRLTKDSRPTTAPSTPERPRTAGARDRPKSGLFSGANSRPKSVISEIDVTTDTQKKTPNYAPWSHDQFLERLKTFSDVRNWTPKPVDISEVEWAKRGWTLVAKDTVGCKGGCEKRLVVKIAEDENRQPRNSDNDADKEDDWWMGDLEKEMVNKYHVLIVDGHAEDCLWRRAGCKDDIYRIKMADPATWQTELRERYLSLLDIEDSLPMRLDLKPQDAKEDQNMFDVVEIARLVPQDVLRRRRSSANDESLSEMNNGTTRESSVTNTNTTALAMALVGWSGQSQNNVKLAYCKKCFQRAGLWLYTPKPPANSSSTSFVDSEDLVFNPIEQHREHCPWKNPATQYSLGRLEGLSGWQVLVTLIKGYKRHDRSPSKAASSRPVSSYTEDGAEEEAKSKEEQEKEDRERRSRLQRLKRAFTVKKGNTLSK
ncbi:uncharacterized protein PV09_04537 [Verruconis gallopava]|uniref:C3HC-type domain-containing protein n=1 Tax=Verruconis gallopava TaxID=253628 RepID=A0A0D1XNS8_9PEZI|nr:uncharacterized protein PV09_04537 [Verruconis gallopava]KIW04231.1 hypothetical protein PV09_04537 [Verruconis gallopava]